MPFKDFARTNEPDEKTENCSSPPPVGVWEFFQLYAWKALSSKMGNNDKMVKMKRVENLLA